MAHLEAEAMIRVGNIAIFWTVPPQVPANLVLILQNPMHVFCDAFDIHHRCVTNMGLNQTDKGFADSGPPELQWQKQEVYKHLALISPLPNMGQGCLMKAALPMINQVGPLRTFLTESQIKSNIH